MGALWREIQDLLFPPACAGCAGPVEHEALCPDCRRRLPGLALGEGWRPLPPLVGVAVAAPFEAGWMDWMHRFKYPRAGLRALDPAADAVICELALQASRMAGQPPDRIVPVPLHRRRLQRRGFNPAELLARTLNRELGAPLDPVALERVRDTPSQTGLGRLERRRNVADAFRARHALPERVWLVDDVLTTGATLAAAARALRQAGARQVTGICAVRTPLAEGRVESRPSGGYNPGSKQRSGSMAKIKTEITLKHQPNLGEEVAEVTFAAGHELTVLKQWDDRLLCKNDAGQLFNVPKDAISD